MTTYGGLPTKEWQVGVRNCGPVLTNVAGEPG